MKYRVALAAKESHKLCFEGAGLSKEAIREEIISGSIPFMRFFKTVANVLHEYSTGDKLTLYENEWGWFPFNELERAKELIARST